MSTRNNRTVTTPPAIDDPAWRPVTYFEHYDLSTRIGATVKGEARRRAAAALIATGDVDQLTGALVAPALSDDERAAAGRFHPGLMGGEYLPDQIRGEVEIARVALASVTGDVISVRARRAGGRIRYRICDEYETDFRCRPATSTRPLTLGQLIAMLENAQEGGITLAWLDYNCEGGADLERLHGFLSVSSAFYPGLEAHYDARIEAWFAEREAELAAYLGS